MSLFEKITLREHYKKQAYQVVGDLIKSEFPPDVKTGKFIVDGNLTLSAPLIVYGTVYVGRKATKKKPVTLTLGSRLWLAFTKKEAK